MRKRLKSKLRSCPLCKPHKRGIATRWSPHELDAVIRADREIRNGHGLIDSSPVQDEYRGQD